VPTTQGSVKVTIYPSCLAPSGSGPVPRDRVGPGGEPDSSNRPIRSFGTDSEFNAALVGSLTEV
jgi:hypothetical protein